MQGDSYVNVVPGLILEDFKLKPPVPQLDVQKTNNRHAIYNVAPLFAMLDALLQAFVCIAPLKL